MDFNIFLFNDFETLDIFGPIEVLASKENHRINYYSLDGKRATSNKRALDWVKTMSDKTEWVNKARWVVSGKYYTSSGVSAGIDIALGFIRV